MSSNTNTRPAPPYTGAPPSMAELMAKIYQMQGTINNLYACINKQPAANTQGTNTGRDIREALKPPKPEPFTGKAADAAAELLALKQHKSCAAYSAKFRQLASKTK
ncbi:hypothetical protein FOMG_17257 [Fusarium oxysporum f. sp. melonis 26406]|uniref:Retrotransposon gag domain-containing protein n=1 Tax=Fusarium oxysporum f. sp. melonis 26406 TaxID=1089452 RepID=W9ZD23_FUSOX|nr:hypothetical protein FOMG_17257 [Fusarium oxysporum f. sp. melonis 26406]